MLNGVSFSTTINSAEISEFSLGFISVQEKGAQLTSHLLDPKQEKKILEACSALSGESTHFEEFVKIEGDYSLRHLSLKGTTNRIIVKKVRSNNSKTICADAALKGSLQEEGFDKILVGALYSGLRTLRRNSDAKWKRTSSDILELSEIQFRILLGTSYGLKVSGIIVYAVG